MKAIKCVIRSESVTIRDTTEAMDPPLSLEEFSGDMELLRNRAVDEKRIREMGERLFRRVFTGNALDQYQRAEPAALALKVSDELAFLPWELLHDGANWTARTRGIIRAVATEQSPPEVIPKPGSLRVLAAIAGPLLHDDEKLPDDSSEQPHLIDVDAHADVFRGLEDGKFPAEIKLRRHITREILSREVSENYHALHFVGHGNIGRLIFETRYGASDLAEESWVREQITVALRGGLRLVIVNSCFSADADDEVPGVAATIVETGVPAVIAMQGAVSEPADIAFVRNLYGALGMGRSIDEAVMDARRAMATDWQVGAWEWATPVLFVNESLLDEEASLNLMDADMVKMMAEPKVRIVEPRRAEIDPMMTREEKFTGRRRELSDVLRSLDPERQDGARVVCLHGDAGMGKTAIAIEAAHRMAEWFDDLIWLSGRAAPPEELREHVKGDDPLARISDDPGFLTALANKCGIELNGSEDRSQLRNSVLINLNDGRRRLLVLDSVERFARSDLIRSFLVNLPANCKALITSRESLEINEGQVHVGPMNSLDSVRLLKAYGELKDFRASPEEMKEIIHFTGGHPMAMRLIVSQVTMAEKTLDDALKDMREAKGRIFDYIFERSLDIAGADGRKLFAAMAVFFPTASRKALQSVCGLSIAGFEGTMKRVVGLSLAESYEQGKRLSLHQLARAKAQELLEKDVERGRYRERAAQFFMDFVNATIPMTRPEIAAKALGAPMLEGKSAQRIQEAAVEIFVKPAVKMLEMELMNCLLALEWLLDKGDLDEATKLLDGLGEFLHTRGHWDMAIHYEKTITEGWRDRGEHHAEAAGLLNLGAVCYNLGRWTESTEYYENALELSREFQDKDLEANALNGLGLVYRSQKKWDEAVRFFENAREIFHQIGDEKEEEEAGVLNNLGTLYQQIGQWEDSGSCLERSREIFERLNNKPGEATALGNLARYYHLYKQDYRQAMELYERAVKIFGDLSYRAEQGDVLHNLGNVYRDQGDQDRAMQYYQRSLDIKSKIGDRVGQQSLLDHLAFIHSRQNQWMRAASACLESFQIAVEIHSSIVVDSVRVILQVSKTMLKSGEFAIPAQLAQQLSQFIQDTEVTDNEIRAALAISHGVLTLISFVAACEFNKESNIYKEALELARSLDEKTGAALNLVNWLEED
jgi:tetratricopeptide (TPR) repeat protein